MVSWYGVFWHLLTWRKQAFREGWNTNSEVEVRFSYNWLLYNCNLVVSRTLYFGTATATLIGTILYFSNIAWDDVCRSREGISTEQISTRMTAMLLVCSFTQATYIQTTHSWSLLSTRLWLHWNLCQDWNNIRLLADMASGQEHGDRLWKMAVLSRWELFHKVLCYHHCYSMQQAMMVL